MHCPTQHSESCETCLGNQSDMRKNPRFITRSLYSQRTQTAEVLAGLL